MLRLICAVASVTLIAACGSGTPVPDAPSQLTPESGNDQIDMRFRDSSAHFATLQGAIIGQTPAGMVRENVWLEGGDARVELSGDISITPYGNFLPPPDLLLWSRDASYKATRSEEVYCGGASDGYMVAPEHLHFVSNYFGEDLLSLDIEGADTIAGRPAIYLVNTVSNQHFWVDAVYGVLLKFQHKFGANTIMQSEFQTITYNEDLDGALFEPDFLDDYRDNCPAPGQ